VCRPWGGYRSTPTLHHQFKTLFQASRSGGQEGVQDLFQQAQAAR